MTERRALVTGVTGQDGTYLAQFLLDKGYEVFGTYRRLSTPNFWRLQTLGVLPKVKLISVDLTDTTSLMEAVEISDPHELYNLAAQSFVGASFEQPVATSDVSGVAVTRILEILRQHSKDCKFYQASSSELYGNVEQTPQSETTPFSPRSPYAIAKLHAFWTTRVYREAYDMFAVNGILFNHESPIRGLEFVTRKISNAVAKISLGLADELRLGNLEAKRDWGYAPEYVKAMWQMLQLDTPMDLVVGTGEAHSVLEFAQIAFECVSLDYQDYVVVDKRFYRPLDVHHLISDPNLSEEVMGWSSRTVFRDIVHLMVKEDIRRWEMWQSGKKFPWDAPFYPEEAILLTRSLRV